ncbi:unnamed protein product [Brassica rapa]|uniref:Neprosin PEP catalytic domain-containing protein n=1 Tax=Brassica campestris TaxID=3711 RepID=A0A8D9GB54_BRACM|nr:unnamed protein product [Brassica rapa]
MAANCKRVSFLLALVMTVVVTLCSSFVSGENEVSDLKISTHLKRLNKPPLKSIKVNNFTEISAIIYGLEQSPDGDVIDCVPITDQPALAHPLLINHTVQMSPSFNPESVFSESKVSSRTKNHQPNDITQLWHVNGKCPENTVPIRRTTKQDLYRASSVESFGMKSQKSIPKLKSYDTTGVLPQNGHQHAIMYVEDGVFYGAKAKINVWNPDVEMPNEFSLAQIWVLGGNFNSDLNSIEAGWQVSPQLYGDNHTRLFTYWTSDAYQGTGCYNLLCSGFVQINREIAMGGSISPLSSYGNSQYDITILIWKSEDGDVIDCVPITNQPAFDHPLLKHHTMQMRPSFIPESDSTYINEETKTINQVWHKAGECPDNTVPIRRTKKEDLLRPKSMKRFGRKPHHSIPRTTTFDPTKGHQVRLHYAIMGARNGKFYGTEVVINLWKPYVQVPDEFSLAQTWIVSGSGSSLNTIEAGWQVYPELYDDNRPRFFVYWTVSSLFQMIYAYLPTFVIFYFAKLFRDGYRRTGCYNLLCSGFVQTSNRYSVGGAYNIVSRYGGTQYDISILIWKDRKTGNWWLRVGKDIIGYWPGKLFTSLGNGATRVEWGGEIVNLKTGGKHTSTDMGSGHFAYEGYKKASYVRNLKIVDGTNTLREPKSLYYFADKHNCYNVKTGNAGTSWGIHFFYGGPGRNVKCP